MSLKFNFYKSIYFRSRQYIYKKYKKIKYFIFFRTIRNKKYDVKQILPLLGGHKIMIEDIIYDLSQPCYKLFKYKGIHCVVCGLEGSFFAKERKMLENCWHLQLYGVKNGKEIMFTKDHIKARSMGGKDSIDNLQVMCSDCNQTKAKLESMEHNVRQVSSSLIKKWRKFYNNTPEKIRIMVEQEKIIKDYEEIINVLNNRFD